VSTTAASLPYQSFSVPSTWPSNGEAGSPSLLRKFAPTGLSAQAYLTYTGYAILSLHATTVLFSIFASAHTNCLSSPARATLLTSPLSPAISPDPVWSNAILTLLPSALADLNRGPEYTMSS